tara:strand:+ start:298 stop:663 length:366 start_codon:yes stop_codon:yes gene_type:complete
MSLNKKEEQFLNNIKHDTLKLINKIEKLEQQIINLDAKYKFKLSDLMVTLEDQNGDIWNALKRVETRTNDRIHALEDAAILEQEQANQNASQPEKWVIEKKGRYATNADKVVLITKWKNNE